MEPRYEGPTVYNYQNLSNSILKEGDLFYVNLPQQRWKSKSTTITQLFNNHLAYAEDCQEGKNIGLTVNELQCMLRHQSEKYKYKIVNT